MSHLQSRIDGFFERYGWTYSRESQETWITGVRTRVSSFRIMVRVTEHWIFFIINPLVVAPENDEDRLRLYYHALRYNLDMNFAKLGVDSDGDMFMAIEMPTENFDYSHFVDALDGLSHHAAMVYVELFNLAHNAEAAKGRYDEELKRGNPRGRMNNLLTRALSAGRSDEDTQAEDPDADTKPTIEDDVIIGGRRLRIFQDENGEARVELESASDEEGGADKPDPKPRKPKKEVLSPKTSAEESDVPKRKRGRPRKSQPDATPPLPPSPEAGPANMDTPPTE